MTLRRPGPSSAVPPQPKEQRHGDERPGGSGQGDGRIDFTMLTTRTESGLMASRPMSNKGEVEYRGNSYCFSWGR
jgi:hypothetical protein